MKNIPTLSAILGATAFALSMPTAFADILEQERTGNEKTQNSDTIEEVIVSAHPLSGEGLAQAIQSLSDKQLQRNLAPSLGETLAAQPGIHSASFGQAVGRPIIHGLGGARVRVMEDRLSTMDVSVTSGDHATTVEPFIADKIEVIKGASTLLYGNGAIGGVVDVHTGRVPHPRAANDTTGRFEASLANNGDQENFAGRVDGSFNNWLWHVDAFDRQADNYKINGFVESAALRASEEEEHEEEEEVGDTLPGSHYQTDGGALGLSYANKKGFGGAAISRTEAQYGLPGGHGHEEEAHDDEEDEEEEHEGEFAGLTPILNMKQTRIDVEAGIKNPFGSFSSLNLRLGHNDYEHSEIEPDGEVATLFQNDAFESRIELTQETGRGRSVYGFQFDQRDFSVEGEEAFVPGVDSRSLGAFWLNETGFERFDLETGVRVERVSHKPVTGSSRSFTTLAASGGLVIPLGEQLTWKLAVDYAERAPVGEELYSFGPHLATNRFEIGDAELDEEKVLSATVGLSYSNAAWDVTLSVYHSDFNDFVYQSSDNRELDELPVFLWDQDDATFTGIDGEIIYTTNLFGERDLSFRGFFDMVSTDIDSTSESNLPLIPPSRVGLSSDLDWQNFALSLDYVHAFKQDDVASFELPTDSYNDLSLYLGWQIPTSRDADLELFLRGDNLTDSEQRHHTSFIKDSAPQPGRRVALGLRYTF
ncbi:TonB-dependent receptor [Pseudomonadales bacterium]|nr:TonB-dependent receptor [Pseudomonadales bacterium]